MLKTFRGGVHPAPSKDLTVDKHIREAPIPHSATIPLLQHTGAPCEPLVSVGDSVKTGQLIGDSDKFISSPIHASISGKVTKIDKHPHPVLGNHKAISIEGKGIDYMDSSIKKREDINSFSADLIRDIIRGAGIVGLGGAAFPTHVKLTPPEGKVIDSIILNGVECEPYLTCDHRLMLEKTKEIIEGLKIIMKLTKAPNIYIGIESNKIGAAFALEKVLRDERHEAKNTKIVILKTKYPQGAEKQLIKSILNREVPPGKLPFDVGCLVSNVGTALAVHETFFEGKPLYERVVTVTGTCLKEPSNLLARVGTSVKDLADACGGFAEEPAKVIFGGPMMGIAQFTLDAPIIKGTSGVLFLSKKEVKEYQEKSCIRCAKCVDICPLNIVPTDIARLIKQGRYMDALRYDIDDCIECGACSYECPSKIPLLQWIKTGKAELLKLRKRT
ncbi:electron transport complex subunit RsxC [Omnitrophica bacterium]|nr:electron transport complex subunit RsxC [Candidatus Omnitrophota bacterium]